ncbi:hypothetical protein JW998_01560 [candidate division KSB1 bacterium]|nr:hypothetical protein [candidate division KSB1 bacterium]
MKNSVRLVISVIFYCAIVRGEEIGTISLGVDNYLAAKEAYSEIRPSGRAIALLAPVRFPNIVAHLKIKFAFHNVDGVQIAYPNAEFLHVANELLVGIKSYRKNRITFLPQIGMGVTGERYKMDKGVGGAHADIFFDLSCRIDYQLGAFSIGALMNLERDLNSGHGSYMSETRLNFALLLAK